MTMRMFRFLLLSTTAILLAATHKADAADTTRDILIQPNMSAVSYPENYVPTPQTAPQPSTPAPPAVAVSEGAVENSSQVPEPVAPQPSANEVSATATTQQTLGDVIQKAYAQSPALRAGRESLRSQYENINQAASMGRPSVSLSAGATATYSDTSPGGDSDLYSRDVGLSGTQFLYRGGRTLAEVDRQIALSAAAQAAYDSLVQTTMLGALTALMDIQRDRMTINLSEKNLEVLRRQLDAAQKGFEVGELTRTDVAQAQARLSGGEAGLVAARGDYANALARFREIAGLDGDGIEIDLAQNALPVPSTLQEAQTQATQDHPDVRSAKESVLAADKNIDVAKGSLLPTLSLTGDATQAWDPTSSLDESQQASLGLRATLPLYEGGANYSSVRQAKTKKYEQENKVEEAVRMAARMAETAWNDLNASRASISAFQNQVTAAQLARDGVYKEREVGSRTVIDTLDADAELLDAQVGLVRAQRNEVVASLNLLAAMGALTPARLGITEAVLAKDYGEDIAGRLFGTDAEPLQ